MSDQQQNPAPVQPTEAKQRPYDKVEDGDLSLPLWKRDGKYGPFLQSSGVEKTFTDKQTGEVKNTRNLSGSGEMLRAARLHDRAADRVVKFREAIKAERSQSQERER